MEIVISTHQGVLYKEEVDYIVVHSGLVGEFGVLKNHVPVVAILDEGYIKLSRDNNELYVIIVNGIFEFRDNLATILAQEAQIGETKDLAKKYLEQIRKERLERNRKDISDFTQKEKELRDHLKNAKAGSL